MKTCKRCKQEKVPSAFCKNVREPDKLSSWCKSCHNRQSYQYKKYIGQKFSPEDDRGWEKCKECDHIRVILKGESACERCLAFIGIYKERVAIAHEMKRVKRLPGKGQWSLFVREEHKYHGDLEYLEQTA